MCCTNRNAERHAIIMTLPLFMASVQVRIVVDQHPGIGHELLQSAARELDATELMVIIAWLRYQTTGYDDLKIPRVKGKRREVRRLLAEQSRRLLDAYRRGAEV